MSRRLRFQIKPNLNLPTAAQDDVKCANTSTTIDAEAKNAPISTADTATTTASEQSIRRSPSPVLTPVTTSSSETNAVIDGIIDTTPGPLANEESATTSKPPDPAPAVDAGSATTTATDKVLTEDTNIGTDNQAFTTPALKKFDWRTMKNTLKGKQLDRSTFLMKDLIYWNPAEDEGDEKSSDIASVKSDDKSEIKRKPKKRYAPHFETPSTEDVSQKQEKLEEKTNAPQVKVNADGSITIDEASLLIDRRDQGTDIDLETIDETRGYVAGQRGPRINSLSFRRNKIVPRGRRWSKFETDKFYRILSFCGLDFDLMHELFKTRSRVEIKRKYKRECTDDPARLDRALSSKVGRFGLWADLKKMIIQRGRCSNDDQGRLLLDKARAIIEEEDDLVELESGLKKPSVAQATRIAKQLSTGGFGDGDFDDDDVSPQQLESMAETIIKDLKKKDRIDASHSKSTVEDSDKRRSVRLKARLTAALKKQQETPESDQQPPLEITE